nr:MAG TPA: hypothetical protein [Caudoviricetes sp.]
MFVHWYHLPLDLYLNIYQSVLGRCNMYSVLPSLLPQSQSVVFHASSKLLLQVPVSRAVGLLTSQLRLD